MSLSRMLMMAVRPNYKAVVLADSPVAFWMLNETSGTTAYDSSGNGNTGTYIGGPTLGASTGLSGLPSGVALNGSGQYVSVPGSASLGAISTAFTVEGWFNMGLVTGGYLGSMGGTNRYIEVVTGPTPTQDALATDGALGMFAVLSGGNINAGNWLTTTAYPVTNGVLHHLVITYLSGSPVGTFVDGVSVANNFSSGSGTVTNSSAQPWMLGGRNLSGTLETAQMVFNNFAIYNTVLSAARIQAHYNAGIG